MVKCKSFSIYGDCCLWDRALCSFGHPSIPIILGFIEFNVKEVKSSDLTTAVATDRAMRKFDYKSRRDTELFPRMIFYNRVGKCGSRSVLRLNGLQSADNTITGFYQLIANL